jgi:hypothetical protein
MLIFGGLLTRSYGELAISGRSLRPHVNTLADLDAYDVTFVSIHDTVNLRHAVRLAHIEVIGAISARALK